ncbi:probable LRR receptor-like serine/threonine-protein kinase At3g47570 [Hevea brasiliensis]|uniref:probable LRR receptor-like serine/threonine-protein kinase At3g47570 n=1 Tax=Hevea brasiliensis TaxID=3981 RepID=UPI0025E30AC8|nr:probable LRR receptor-like serine/threonine-protein kinase At3g47570 [Hevea brasiliensis]
MKCGKNGTPTSKTMRPSPSICARAFPALFTLLQWRLLLFVSSSFPSATAATVTQNMGGNKTDYEALLAFKSKITQDPHGIVSSWNDSLHFCKWPGVTCGRRHRRVTMISLMSNELVGSLSPSVGNLSFLRGITLSNNTLHGEIPPEIGRLFRLQVLRLTNNSLEGQIPSNLSRCINLIDLSLGNNKLRGKIPVELGYLSKLRVLSIYENHLQGEIPYSIANLSSLETLSASENFFEGSIPHAAGQLKSLTAIGLGGNKLSGIVPPSLYNLSLITIFSLGDNQLRGSLPPDLGLSFPHLQHIDVRNNQFVGPIPLSIFNASELQLVLLANNNFTGKILNSFGSLPYLTLLGLDDNSLGDGEEDEMDFLGSLANCSSLKVLAIGGNRLGGSLPNTVGNLSTFIFFLGLSGNRISGVIPEGIGNLVSLTLFDLSRNRFTGKIPSSIGKLQNLQRLSLYANGLSGKIPSAVGNLSWLAELYLDYNMLQGDIPSSLKNCTNLLSIYLSHNNLSGNIPSELFGISSLSISLSIAHNQFTGPLPSSVGNLKSLGELDVSWNRLSSEIPTSLGASASLEKLYMENNLFDGSIPSSFSSLTGIQILDLSHNNLSGKIPNYFVKIPFIYLNLSYNNFEGEIPKKGVFTNGSAVSIVGNDRLCGGISKLNLAKCPSKEPRKHKISRFHLSVIIIPCALLGLTVVLSFLFCWFRKKKKEQISGTSLKEPFAQISYEKLLRATGAFSMSNLIGVGSFGSVYRGSIDEDGTVTAIKVLNLQRRGASRSFTAECEALRNIRHRNLVRIITSCSSIDFQGNDFKALVYEYMPNGSLETWLHPVQETYEADRQHKVQNNLSLLRRINIAIDVAYALDYLHHHCHQPIIHCDLKPSNILLDSDMTAHVGDFGLARILPELSKPNQSSSIGIKGTVGYAAPEYGLGTQVSIEGDIYSYGIVVLEMITGKRPTDNMFESGLNLHKFARKSLPDNVMEIVDPMLLRDDMEIMNKRQSINTGNRMEECLISMVEIALACSMESPRDRMDMSKVVHELHKVRDVLQESTAKPHIFRHTDK